MQKRRLSVAYSVACKPRPCGPSTALTRPSLPSIPPRSPSSRQRPAENKRRARGNEREQERDQDDGRPSSDLQVLRAAYDTVANGRRRRRRLQLETAAGPAHPPLHLTTAVCAVGTAFEAGPMAQTLLAAGALAGGRFTRARACGGYIARCVDLSTCMSLFLSSIWLYLRS
jgi:hypothetical protein